MFMLRQVKVLVRVWGNIGCPCFIGLWPRGWVSEFEVHIGDDMDIIPRPHIQAFLIKRWAYLANIHQNSLSHKFLLVYLIINCQLKRPVNLDWTFWISVTASSSGRVNLTAFSQLAELLSWIVLPGILCLQRHIELVPEQRPQRPYLIHKSNCLKPSEKSNISSGKTPSTPYEYRLPRYMIIVFKSASASHDIMQGDLNPVSF